jgi:hypothetical protein
VNLAGDSAHNRYTPRSRRGKVSRGWALRCACALTAATFLRRLQKNRDVLPLVLSACFWLGISWLVLDIMPFRLYRYLLNPRQCHPRESGNGALAGRVRKAVNLAARCVPWRTVCFHRAIAAQQMLRRRGAPAVLHYGVAPLAEAGLNAHVWVTCDGAAVVGGDGTEAVFTELATFRGDRHASSSARYAG